MCMHLTVKMMIVHLFVEEVSSSGRVNALKKAKEILYFQISRSQSFDPGKNRNVGNDLQNTSNVPEEPGQAVLGGGRGQRCVTQQQEASRQPRPMGFARKEQLSRELLSNSHCPIQIPSRKE